MSEVEILTWLDYEGPEFTHLCPNCQKPMVDESTAVDTAECDAYDEKFVDDPDHYISLRCKDFPACPVWETSSDELKEQRDELWREYHLS
jgi:hypothetical protein